MVTLHLIPPDITASYEMREWRNAAGVLKTAHEAEWNDIIAMLRDFEFKRSELLRGGGAKTLIAKRIDDFLEARNWAERKFATKLARWEAWRHADAMHHSSHLSNCVVEPTVRTPSSHGLIND